VVTYFAFALLLACSGLLAQTPGNAPAEAQAQYNRGVDYWEGRGVPQDYAEAANWFRKAAEQGFAEAQNRLGQMLAMGQGIPRDDAEAAAWYRKAADQGVMLAQYNLGSAYVMGSGVTKDFAEAVKWFRKAADQGSVGAQFNVAWRIVRARASLRTRRRRWSGSARPRIRAMRDRNSAWE
jgi:TPR repeat protein